MNKDNELTRAELLQRGIAGLTLLTMAPLAVSCADPKPKARILEQPEPEHPVGYRESFPFDPGFVACRGLGVDGNSIWVAGDSRISRFEKGKAEESHELPGAAQAVAVAPDGVVFAAIEDRVIELSKGQQKAWESLGPRSRIVELIAGKDEVYAADAGNRCVVRYSRDGKVLGKIGERNPAADYQGLIVPSPYLGLAQLEVGSLAICSPGAHRIEIHLATGGLKATIGKSGQEMAAFCGCCNPMAIALLPTGDFVTAEKGIPRVKVITRAGELKTVVAPPSAFDSSTTGLELAVQGDKILVLDPRRRKVRAFEVV